MIHMRIRPWGGGVWTELTLADGDAQDVADEIAARMNADNSALGDYHVQRRDEEGDWVDV